MKLFNLRCFFVFIPLLVFIVTLAVAEESTSFKRSGFVELGAGYAKLTGSYQDWNDQYLVGSWQLTPTDRVNGEISNQDHFGDQGLFIGAGYTRIFNEDWYGLLSAGTSEGGFFLPRVRVDGSIHKKWLEKKNLVTGLGFTYYDAKDVHTDRTLLLSLLYYFDAPWIMEIGARLNRSSPGPIDSGRGFIALTYGQNKQRYITLRYDDGSEAYQSIGTDTLISDFSSREAALIWRQWITEDYGFNLLVVHYENPTYERSGVALGVFVDF
jgi:YaiO family outer membrane protein